MFKKTDNNNYITSFVKYWKTIHRTKNSYGSWERHTWAV